MVGRVQGRGWNIAAAASIFAACAVVGTQIASGAGESAESVFVSITPCRLIDTRPGDDVNVGPRATAIGAEETATFTAWGSGDADSPCDIPATATAIATNTVAIAPTARSFMTLYPAGVDNPGTANLNYTAGQAPTPNAANVPLSASGEFNVFNAFGTVHVVIDVNGFFQPSDDVGAKGPQGDQGPTGPDGTDGAVGPAGASGDPYRFDPADMRDERWELDPAKPATIGPTGDVPHAMVTDGDVVYVANFSNTGSSEVTVIDPGTNSVVARVPVDGYTNDLHVHDGLVYVAVGHPDGVSPGTVRTIDPATRAFTGTSVTVGVIPAGMTVVDDVLFVANAASNSVSVVDLASGTVVATISVGASPRGVARSATDVYVANALGNTVSVIDPNDLGSGATSITVGLGPNDVAYGAGQIWVANTNFANTSGESSVSVIDPSTNTVTNTILLGEPTSPTAVAFDGTSVYLANYYSNTVDVIDPLFQTVVGTIPVGAGPWGAMFDGTSVWVSNSLDNTVQRILPR
ncbi:hypothetical protein YM304_09810 [Ilumatobacter coccineus YM16-304]|uniref:Uncharacterized protein n=1 Tax=Ilumatobacter coccineus (strain NBRC 103263 / KCTC 29153 / YM16-304) TaxID=1313172 RepID=A0A6C7E813_ILUCY|nr:hypothetical protein YM304_09810 [Ilumatobacter coccineus YM16-304]